MTTKFDLERSVTEWFHEEADDVTPRYLGEIADRVARTRQRPWWASPERWLPTSLTSRANAVAIPPIARLVLVGLLILGLVIATIIAAGSPDRRLPPPFGLARNGTMVTAVGGHLYTVDPISGATTPLAPGSPGGSDFGPMFSRDGTKLLYVRGVDGGRVELVVANADGTAATAVSPAVDVPDQVDWSPDGTRLVFLARDQGRGRINVVGADGTGLHTLSIDGSANQVSWLAPDGADILFRREHLVDADPAPAIVLVHPDGSNLRPVTTRTALDNDDFQDITCSPDGTTVMYRESALKGFFQIHVLHLRSRLDQILPSPRNSPAQTGPVFSPDGIHVAYLQFHLGHVVQLVVAPLDGSSTGTELPLRGDLGPDGPTINNYFFTPDGTAIVVNELNSRTEWLLPIDGSPGKVLARGTQPYDGLTTIQRLAP